MTKQTLTAAAFTYDVHSDEAADEFFELMERSNVQAERVAAMKQTRAAFLAEARS
jgi:hypothetical protein